VSEANHPENATSWTPAFAGVTTCSGFPWLRIDHDQRSYKVVMADKLTMKINACSESYLIHPARACGVVNNEDAREAENYRIRLH